MKTLITNEKNYFLHNSENFKEELDSNGNYLVSKIAELYTEYVKFIAENMRLRNSNFSRFIITRGLDTIMNVFNFILLYTKNIELTYFHCQKAYYLYVEFVGQISEDEKIFLQLSSRDATCYVYKKTIFEINSDLRKNNGEITEKDKPKFKTIRCYMELYKLLLLKWVNDDFYNTLNLKLLYEIYLKLNTLSEKPFIEALNPIIENLFYEIQDTNKFYRVIVLIIKKITKKPSLIQNIRQNLKTEDHKDKLLDNPDKIIEWLVSSSN